MKVPLTSLFLWRIESSQNRIEDSDFSFKKWMFQRFWEFVVIVIDWISSQSRRDSYFQYFNNFMFIQNRKQLLQKVNFSSIMLLSLQQLRRVSDHLFDCFIEADSWNEKRVRICYETKTNHGRELLMKEKQKKEQSEMNKTQGRQEQKHKWIKRRFYFIWFDLIWFVCGREECEWCWLMETEEEKKKKTQTNNHFVVC